MNIIYAQEDLDLNNFSVFLAGPSPRTSDVLSWRKEAISLFSENKFTGTLCIPELRIQKNKKFDYLKQISWEEEALLKVDIIMFWIPRDLNTLPGFTTNIEWGFWLAKEPSKLILGSPKNTPKMDYINYYADKYSVPRFSSLNSLVGHINELRNKNDSI